MYSDKPRTKVGQTPGASARIGYHSLIASSRTLAHCQRERESIAFGRGDEEQWRKLPVQEVVRAVEQDPRVLQDGWPAARNQPPPRAATPQEGGEVRASEQAAIGGPWRPRDASPCCEARESTGGTSRHESRAHGSCATRRTSRREPCLAPHSLKRTTRSLCR